MKKSSGLLIVGLLIKWSGLAVVDGRNKIGGTVFGTGMAGAFARNKVTPINRRSSGQSLARAIFTSFSQLWRTLTTGQREAWNSLASNVTYHNIFGDSKHISGKSLLQRLNTNLVKVGQSPNSNAPDINAAAAGALGFNPTSSVAGMSLFISAIFSGLASLVPAGNSLYISATPKMSAGITAPKQSKFRFIGTIIGGADTVTTNLLSDYVGVFGSSPALDDNIWIQISSVNNTSGFSSTVLEGPLVITA